MNSSSSNPADKFDTSRANEYARQSRIALAGYDACQDLAACMLAASLGDAPSAKVLVVGAGGTAQEIIAMASLEPEWRFMAVDPSQPMLDAARQQLEANHLLDRTTLHLGTLEDLAAGASYDAATLIGVLHHLEGDDAKARMLRSIRAHLKPGAPLIVAGNHYAYASHPLLLAAWRHPGRSEGQARQNPSRRRPATFRGRCSEAVARRWLRRRDPFLQQPVLGGLADV